MADYTSERAFILRMQKIKSAASKKKKEPVAIYLHNVYKFLSHYIQKYDEGTIPISEILQLIQDSVGLAYRASEILIPCPEKVQGIIEPQKPLIPPVPTSSPSIRTRETSMLARDLGV